MALKKRLDKVVLEHYPHHSRTHINSWIMQGKVEVDGEKVVKPGAPVREDSSITLNIEEPRYVCRAGFKLEKALAHFTLNVQGMTVLDAGLSTGGFTDCLLQHGASKIYGIDVGHGQVHERIWSDERVIVMEKTNLRYLTALPERVDLITLDLSFISLLKVMDTVTNILKLDGSLITLIKPQFEAERHEVGKKGIIKDPEIHQKVVEKVISGISAHGFTCHGVIESPIKGTTGNTEFLAYFTRKK